MVTDEAVRFRYDPQTAKRVGGRQHVLDLPGDGMHYTRTLRFRPDSKNKKMYVSVGSSSNVTPERDARRVGISVADPDGKNSLVYASGLRKAVGISFNPETGELWASVPDGRRSTSRLLHPRG